MPHRPWLSIPHACLLAAAALVAYPLPAQGETAGVYAGEDPARHASVRVLEGEATVLKGDDEELLGRGFPIGEGDLVDSRGRGILQLADGSRVAFAPGTRFQVASLFAGEPGHRRVLLRLDAGRLRVVQGRDSEALLRVDTASGTGTLDGNASATFEVEPDRTLRVRVELGRIAFANDRDRVSLAAGERLTAYGSQDRLDRIRNFNTYAQDTFDDWCERNLALQRGPGWDRLPPELRPYSGDLDGHGEWIYVDEYRAWCWRPLGLAADWRPYWRGRWAAFPGGMTWVSDEPWGYVTYHHGRWGWRAGVGWYWIPGIAYAPAWVAWRTADVYFGWAPLGFYDAPVVWGYGPWHGGACWNVVEIQHIHAPRIHTWTHFDPPVIRRFEPSPQGNRPLSSPWNQGPVVVTPAEFRDPARFQQATRDPGLSWNRLQDYGARTGGGLTVIANAPNPAGFAILKGSFEEGINPVALAVAASPPTLVAAAAFQLLPG